ncbi:MAG: adenosylcobinamide-GDP ribazoletransferase, partial [Lachnoclostridium sp.]|nr:adenosylcobinamide-GDP ribazoletransferase [Lachnoclostridium sp.]
FLILAAAGMCAVHLRAAAGALLAEVLVFWYYKKMSTRQFGGVTGDLAGYFLEISELAMLTGMMLTGGYLWN